MYRKNTAGQFIGFVAINVSTGATMTGTSGFAAFRVLDGGAQASATGSITDKGNGQYSFALSQADTNGNDCSILFTMTSMLAVEKTFLTTVLDPTSTGFGLVNASANVVQILGTASAGTAGFMAPDWGHVNAPTTTVALTGTSISTAQVVASVSGSVGSVTGSVGGSVGSVTGAVGSVTGSVGSVTGSIGGNVIGNVTGSVGSILTAPFKVNTASAFSIFMVSSSDNKSPYTGGSVTATRSINGATAVAVTGSVTQVGSTNEYYFSGAAADFNGATVSFIFTASGANTVQVTINTQP